MSKSGTDGNKEGKNKDRRNSEQERHSHNHKKTAVCRYYVEDKCRFKDNCWFSHDDQDIAKEAEKMKERLSFLESSMRRTRHR